MNTMKRNPNRICNEMGWPVPLDGENLIIIVEGHRRAVLNASNNERRELEGVYLLASGPGVPDSCYSASPLAKPHQIRAGLAHKLFANGRDLKPGELSRLVEKLATCVVKIEGKPR